MVGSHGLAEGQVVRVRALLETLDRRHPGGSLHGLPFMPEMDRHSAQSFPILRLPSKTCVQGHVIPNLSGPGACIDGARPGSGAVSVSEFVERAMKAILKQGDWVDVMARRKFEATLGTGGDAVFPRRSLVLTRDMAEACCGWKWRGGRLDPAT